MSLIYVCNIIIIDINDNRCMHDNPAIPTSSFNYQILVILEVYVAKLQAEPL